MHIIPVVDIRHGIAVRAVAGERGAYQPLRSPLGELRGQSHGSEPGATPLEVVRAYRALFAFPTIYLADLDGIEGRGRDVGLGERVHEAVPDVGLWIDAGQGRAPSAATLLQTTVVGSEAMSERDLEARIPEHAVLSLDFRGDDFLGPRALLERDDLWPPRVIVMTLARVGSNRGPDLPRMGQIARRVPHIQIYAAGGIRDVADLREVHAAGAHGALIASALHAGKIKADDLAEIIGL